MKNLKTRLSQHSKFNNVTQHVIEQDYLLSWLLEAFSENSLLTDTLVFKGGTALKKCYFKDYRFSEDLDFTAKDGAPENKQLEDAIRQLCLRAEELMNEIADVRLSMQRYREKSLHPHRQEAFSIYAQFPWQRQPLVKVMIEVTYAEKILTPTKTKPILHSYEEPLNGVLTVYSPEEIILEKLRAILENAKKLHERGWARSRVRDFFDLYYLFEKLPEQIDWPLIQENLHAKFAHKSISYSSYEDFFSKEILDDAKRHWSHFLSHLMPTTVGYDEIMTILQRRLKTQLPEISQAASS